MSEFETIPVHQTADSSGLMCPEPVLMASRELARLDSAQTLLLLATDAHAQLDIEVFCARTGHKLVRAELQADQYRFWIQKR